MLYDVFISHASEDKDSFVRKLAERLKNNHIEVWYDEFTLRPGESIRRSIDLGLSKSRYGIVVLSQAFFKKEWTQWELDGLVQRMNRAKNNLIVPIWHGITYEEVLDYSPSLADKVAILSSKGIDHVISELLKVLKPEGSTLIEARDCLLEYKYEPPVVTDDWWLDVLEFSGSPFHLENWGFPLTPKTKESFSRGEQVAWAAMQMMWQQKAETDDISQITHPDKVLKFIQDSPGLEEMCFSFPDYLAAYVPQLTIIGFGGKFEDLFEQCFINSVEHQKLARLHNSKSGSALTTNSLAPSCESWLALRHPTFGDYEPSTVACHFVQGELMGHNVKIYDCIDYIIWFLSSDSRWMPENIRVFLLKGMKEWIVWPWTKYEIINNGVPGYDGSRVAGKLAEFMCRANDLKDFTLTESCIADIKTRINTAIYYIETKDSVDDLYEKFMNEGFIQNWFDFHKKRKNKHSG